MIRVTVHARVWREIGRAPEEARAWASEWVEAAKAPDATFSQVIAGATPLKGGEFRNCYVRKLRRKKPHGEYRLVFRATEDEVIFASLEPRGGDYKIAGRRIRAIRS